MLWRGAKSLKRIQSLKWENYTQEKRERGCYDKISQPKKLFQAFKFFLTNIPVYPNKICLHKKE